MFKVVGPRVSKLRALDFGSIAQVCLRDFGLTKPKV